MPCKLRGCPFLAYVQRDRSCHGPRDIAVYHKPVFYRNRLKDRTVFTRATLVSAGISCLRVSVRPSVPSRCSTETAKRRITQTTHTIARDSSFLTPTISEKLTQGRPQRRREMQVGYVKCSWGSWTLATVDAKRCQLSSVANLSHVRRAAVRRARFVSNSWSLPV